MKRTILNRMHELHDLKPVKKQANIIINDEYAEILPEIYENGLSDKYDFAQNVANQNKNVFLVGGAHYRHHEMAQKAKVHYQNIMKKNLEHQAKLHNLRLGAPDYKPVQAIEVIDNTFFEQMQTGFRKLITMLQHNNVSVETTTILQNIEQSLLTEGFKLDSEQFYTLKKYASTADGLIKDDEFIDLVEYKERGNNKQISEMIKNVTTILVKLGEFVNRPLKERKFAMDGIKKSFNAEKLSSTAVNATFDKTKQFIRRQRLEDPVLRKQFKKTLQLKQDIDNIKERSKITKELLKKGIEVPRTEKEWEEYFDNYRTERRNLRGELLYNTLGLATPSYDEDGNFIEDESGEVVLFLPPDEKILRARRKIFEFLKKGSKHYKDFKDRKTYKEDIIDDVIAIDDELTKQGSERRTKIKDETDYISPKIEEKILLCEEKMKIINDKTMPELIIKMRNVDEKITRLEAEGKPIMAKFTQNKDKKELQKRIDTATSKYRIFEDKKKELEEELRDLPKTVLEKVERDYLLFKEKVYSDMLRIIAESKISLELPKGKLVVPDSDGDLDQKTAYVKQTLAELEMEIARAKSFRTPVKPISTSTDDSRIAPTPLFDIIGEEKHDEGDVPRDDAEVEPTPEKMEKIEKRKAGRPKKTHIKPAEPAELKPIWTSKTLKMQNAKVKESGAYYKILYNDDTYGVTHLKDLIEASANRHELIGELTHAGYPLNKLKATSSDDIVMLFNFCHFKKLV